MNRIVSRTKLFVFFFLLAIFSVQAASLPTVAADEVTDSIDTNQWYRLTNSFLGEGYALDTYGDTHEPFMGDSGNYSGQYWRFTPEGDGYYRLSNMFLGNGRSLDTYGDTHEPFMGDSGNYSGQLWTLTPLGDGYFRLSNMYLGNGRSLDTYSDTYAPFMGDSGNYSGQYWQLTALGPIEETAPTAPEQDDFIPAEEPPVLPDDEQVPDILEDEETDQNDGGLSNTIDFTLGDVGQACDSQNACGSGMKCVDVSYLNAEHNAGALSQSVCMQDDAEEVVEALRTLDYEVCASMVGGPTAGKVAVFSDMASELNSTVTIGAGYSSSKLIGNTAEAGFMIGPDGQAGCYITQCFGAQADVQSSIYENIGIFNAWSSVPGRAFVTSQGVSVPFVEAGYTTSQVMSGGNLVGAVNTFSVGVGVLPVDLSGMACTTSVVQIRPEVEQPDENEVLSMREEAQKAVDVLENKIETLHATIQAERDNNTQHFEAAQADIQIEQDKVNQLNQEIEQLQTSIQTQRERDAVELQGARNDVAYAQQDVDKLRTDINNTQQQIDQINDDLAAKKRWLDNKSFFDKVWAGPEYAAFAAAKRIEQAALYSKIAGLEVALQTATLALDTAKNTLHVMEASIDTFPIDSDPRLVSLFAARDTAIGSLEAAKLAVGGTSDLLNAIPIESDPRMIDLYIELGLAKAELEVLY